MGFGGGCHWCTEAVFAALKGVGRVEQGFIRSKPPDDGWSEAVRLGFDPDEIDREVLIEAHLRTHASTSNHSMRGKYRSAVYVVDEAQGEAVRATLGRLQAGFERPLVTRVLSLGAFRASAEPFRNYHEKQAGGPFCTRYIDPKLARLRRDFAAHVR
ncbi:peptide-methionine (S)-S-oxide reductase [Roseovarius indicus]|uniref:peptide-methionine (S)-S-oxide reductase n=1 Tax=Roseovarius indicus TaxID=540747 RepID=UPI001F1607E4|nr:peptide-methionine (S)-S-oxide reductase [Roseovarius indicus]